MRSPFRRLVLLLAVAALLGPALGCATAGSEAERFTKDRKVRTHYAVAMEHLREGRTALAIRELLAAEQLDPEDPWIQVGLAEAFRWKGRHEDSERHLLRALAIDPKMHAALLNLSALYVQTERYEEAIPLATRLLDDPTFAVPWKALANIGWAQYKLGRHREAREALDHALDFEPGFWPAMLSLAVVDAEEGKRLEAMQRLEQVLALEPGPMARAEAHYRMAELYISLGNRAEAMHHLSAASQTRPNGEWGRRSQDYLKRLR